MVRRCAKVNTSPDKTFEQLTGENLSSDTGSSNNRTIIHGVWRLPCLHHIQQWEQSAVCVRLPKACRGVVEHIWCQAGVGVVVCTCWKRLYDFHCESGQGCAEQIRLKVIQRGEVPQETYNHRKPTQIRRIRTQSNREREMLKTVGFYCFWKTSRVHQGCIYLIQNIVKTNIITIFSRTTLHFRLKLN